MADEKLKILLIIEDEEALRKAMSTALEKAGYEVHQAANGEDGLKLADEVRPNVLLVDHYMPKMTGLDMIKQIRGSEWGSEPVIIMLTNDNTTELLNESLQAGVNGHFIKAEMSIDDIHKIVEENLERKASS